MTDTLTTALTYEDGFRRGIAWAASAPLTELQELVESTKPRGWTSIPLRDDWSSLRVELAPVALDLGGSVELRRDPFVIGFVDSASFLFWDEDTVDDED